MKAFLVCLAWVPAALSASAMELTSPDIKDGAPIARAFYYTSCGGQNVAPALAWSGAPRGVGSYAVTVIDTSVAPSGWSHWIVVSVPSTVHALPRGGALPNGASAVRSNFGDLIYAGPCPPLGTGLHRYAFTVYALPGTAPVLAADAKAMDVSAALASVALATATLTVTAQQ